MNTFSLQSITFLRCQIFFDMEGTVIEKKNISQIGSLTNIRYKMPSALIFRYLAGQLERVTLLEGLIHPGWFKYLAGKCNLRFMDPSKAEGPWYERLKMQED